jgi:hypothetical protein
MEESSNLAPVDILTRLSSSTISALVLQLLAESKESSGKLVFDELRR